jgi:hypothetical protein
MTGCCKRSSALTGWQATREKPSKCLRAPRTLWRRVRELNRCSDSRPCPHFVSRARAIGWLASSSLSPVASCDVLVRLPRVCCPACAAGMTFAEVDDFVSVYENMPTLTDPPLVDIEVDDILPAVRAVQAGVGVVSNICVNTRPVNLSRRRTTPCTCPSCGTTRTTSLRGCSTGKSPTRRVVRFVLPCRACAVFVPRLLLVSRTFRAVVVCGSVDWARFRRTCHPCATCCCSTQRTTRSRRYVPSAVTVSHGPLVAHTLSLALSLSRTLALSINLYLSLSLSHTHKHKHTHPRRACVPCDPHSTRHWTTSLGTAVK